MTTPSPQMNWPRGEGEDEGCAYADISIVSAPERLITQQKVEMTWGDVAVFVVALFFTGLAAGVALVRVGLAS